MGSKSKVKGFNLFADMRKGSQTFSDRSDALNSAVGSDTTVTFEDTVEDSLSAEERAVLALTNAVKEYRSTIKGKGLGKKTIDGFKEITRNALGVKRMGGKRYHQIIDLCSELEVITKDSGRSYFSVVDVPTIVEEQSEEQSGGTDPLPIRSYTERDKKVVALWEQYLSDKDKYCDEDGQFVSTCTCCGSIQMTLYLDSKRKLRCGACNDLHYEESYNLYPHQVSSTDEDMIGAVKWCGKKTKKGIKHNGWLVTTDEKLVRTGK